MHRVMRLHGQYDNLSVWMQQNGVKMTDSNKKCFARLEEFLKESRGIITASYCRENGIPTVYLTRLEREGILTRLSSGLYVTENADYDEHYFFQHRFSKAIYSYETAAFLQNLTDKIPQDMDVTVNYSYKFNDHPVGVNVNYVKDDIYPLGIVTATTAFGNPVKVYSYERIICDFIAHKERIDFEVYIQLVRSYAQYESKSIDSLLEIADKMRIITDVRKTMELMYE